jgi:hypothetical protein
MLPVTVLPVKPENPPGLRRAGRGANGQGYSVKTVRNYCACKKELGYFPALDAPHANTCQDGKR